MLFHIADRTRWEASLADGSYTQSTRGMELDAVGFIHLASQTQVSGVLDRFYEGVEDLVLLHIDESRLTARVMFEPAPGTDELFPHLYGPLDTDAVVAVTTIRGA